MKIEELKISKYHRKRNGHFSQKTGKITIITTDKVELTLEQQDKLFIFLDTL